MNKPEPKLYRIVSAVIQKDDMILLVKSRDENGSVWGLPGGRVENSESLKDAIKREVNEETGLEICDIELAYIHESYIPEFNAHSLVTVFRVNVEHYKTCLGNDPDNEILSLKWVKSSDIDKYIINKSVVKPVSLYLDGCAKKYYLDEYLSWR